MLSALSLARRVRVRALAPAPVQAATLFFPPSANASPFAGAGTLPFLLGGVRCATSKAGGSSRNGRDSRPKFLGVKRFGGERVEPGDIILRQRGARVGIVESTASVGMGRDHTIFALKPGFVKFWRHRLRRKSFVEVVRSPPQMLLLPGAGGAEAAAAAAAPPLKYPIVRLRRGDLPHLLKLVDRAGSAAGCASVDMSAEVRRQLDAFRATQQQAGSGGGGAGAGGGGAGRAQLE